MRRIYLSIVVLSVGLVLSGCNTLDPRCIIYSDEIDDLVDEHKNRLKRDIRKRIYEEV
jgi:hypothetical protein